MQQRIGIKTQGQRHDAAHALPVEETVDPLQFTLVFVHGKPSDWRADRHSRSCGRSWTRLVRTALKISAGTAGRYHCGRIKTDMSRAFPRPLAKLAELLGY